MGGSEMLPGVGWGEVAGWAGVMGWARHSSNLARLNLVGLCPAYAGDVLGPDMLPNCGLSHGCCREHPYPQEYSALGPVAGKWTRAPGTPFFFVHYTRNIVPFFL